MRSDRLLSSTSFRLSVIYAALLLISFALAGVGAWIATRSAALDQAEPMLKAAYDLVERQIERNGIAAAERALQPGPASSEILRWRLDGPDGANVAGDISIPDSATGLHFADLSDDPRGDAQGDHAILTGVIAGGQRLSIATDIEDIEHIRDTALTALILVGLLSVILALGAGVWATRRTLRRMEALSQAARAFGAGDLAARAPARLSKSPDDIDELVTNFNVMLERVNLLVDNVRRVSADVAHDLRTPLTHVRQRLESAGRASTPEAHATAIEAAQTNIDDILRSFDAVLRLAEIEAGAMRERFAETDLAEVVERVCDAYRPDIEASRRSLTTRIQHGVTVRGDAQLLAQAAANLLENAMRHTPAGAAVSVEVSRDADGARLVVSDNGPGVPVEARAQVIEPFKRLDQSRTTPGSGLGLSIVDAIARLHEATLALEDANPGLRVVALFGRG